MRLLRKRKKIKKKKGKKKTYSRIKSLKKWLVLETKLQSLTLIPPPPYKVPDRNRKRLKP